VRRLALLLLLAGCGGQAQRMAAALTGGDPSRGRSALRAHGCGSCHDIPGVRGAQATVGPPLSRLARRQYLAGLLPNTPPNLLLWVQHPQRVLPGNAMPDLPVPDSDARDMAAYLYTLD